MKTSIQAVRIPCPACGGYGRTPPSHRACLACDGHGVKWWAQRIDPPDDGLNGCRGIAVALWVMAMLACAGYVAWANW